MSESATTPSGTAPTPAAPLHTLPFFLSALALSAAALLPAILAQRGTIPGPAEPYLALAPIAVFSPTLAAMLVSRFERGGAGIRAVFRPLLRWAVAPYWYAIAFAIVPLSWLAGVAIYRAAGGTGAEWWYPPARPEQLLALLLVPLGEEIGWRGFALPRLHRRYGPLPGSLIMGLGWGLWHVPMFLVVGVPFGWVMAVMVLFLVPGSVIYSWLYERSGRLLPIAVVAHVGTHTIHSLDTLPDNPAPLFVHLAALAAVAVGLVAFDREVWRAPAA